MSLPPLSPETNKWSKYMLEIFTQRKPPPLGTVAIKEIEEKAREKMKAHINAFLYVFGSAGTYSTDHANRAAFDRYRIIPRMMVDATHRNLETTIFGTKFPAPLLFAPIGVQAIVHGEAELATARAAAALGVPMIMSTASSRSIEQVGEANGNGIRWYQLYWPKTHEITVSLLKRAKASGFTALVVTLDTPLLGWRPHDLAKAYIPFGHGTGTAVGTSDPVFMALQNESVSDAHVEFPYDPDVLDKKAAEGDPEVLKRSRLGKAWLGETNSGHFRTWKDIALLREAWDGPIVLKGIQSVEDAETAVDYVDGIVVSNHGGRQVDGAIASLDALARIGLSEKIRAAQDSGKFTVLFDSGIRTGSDIIKALALGAQAVLLGRPYIYGLCLGGQQGIQQVVQSVLADLDLTTGLIGKTDISSIYRHREILDITPL